MLPLASVVAMKQTKQELESHRSAGEKATICRLF
jgi:hypothetical protein